MGPRVQGPEPIPEPHRDARAAGEGAQRGRSVPQPCLLRSWRPAAGGGRGCQAARESDLESGLRSQTQTALGLQTGSSPVSSAAPWAGCTSSLTSLGKSKDQVAVPPRGPGLLAPWPPRPPAPATSWLCRCSPRGGGGSFHPQGPPTTAPYGVDMTTQALYTSHTQGHTLLHSHRHTPLRLSSAHHTPVRTPRPQTHVHPLTRRTLMQDTRSQFPLHTAYVHKHAPVICSQAPPHRCTLSFTQLCTHSPMNTSHARSPHTHTHIPFPHLGARLRTLTHAATHAAPTKPGPRLHSASKQEKRSLGCSRPGQRRGPNSNACFLSNSHLRGQLRQPFLTSGHLWPNFVSGIPFPPCTNQAAGDPCGRGRGGVLGQRQVQSASHRPEAPVAGTPGRVRGQTCVRSLSCPRWVPRRRSPQALPTDGLCAHRQPCYTHTSPT